MVEAERRGFASVKEMAEADKKVEEDIEKFQEAWEEEWHEAPTSMGWQEDDTELWFSGELEITEIEDGDE